MEKKNLSIFFFYVQQKYECVSNRQKEREKRVEHIFEILNVLQSTLNLMIWFTVLLHLSRNVL